MSDILSIVMIIANVLVIVGTALKTIVNAFNKSSEQKIDKNLARANKYIEKANKLNEKINLKEVKKNGENE